MQSEAKEYLKRRIEETSLTCDCGEKDNWIHLSLSEKPFFSRGFWVTRYFFSQKFETDRANPFFSKGFLHLLEHVSSND